MQGLSDRLRVIEEYIRQGDTVVDIGTDHGLLPVFLCKSGKCPWAVMTDISRQSLSTAARLGRDLIDEGNLIARVGNGLIPLAKGEVDTVVMAGMGGNLMVEILSADVDKAQSFARYILQPRKAQGPLRYYLHQQGYSILGERLVEEGRHLCEIILASREASLPVYANTGFHHRISDNPQSIQWEVPSYYGEITDPLAEEYLMRKKCREEEILAGRRQSYENGKATAEDVKETEDNITYIQWLMEERRKSL